jgi:hypothetical protein
MDFEWEDRVKRVLGNWVLVQFCGGVSLFRFRDVFVMSIMERNER